MMMQRRDASLPPEAPPSPGGSSTVSNASTARNLESLEQRESPLRALSPTKLGELSKRLLEGTADGVVSGSKAAAVGVMSGSKAAADGVVSGSKALVAGTGTVMTGTMNLMGSFSRTVSSGFMDFASESLVGQRRSSDGALRRPRLSSDDAEPAAAQLLDGDGPESQLAGEKDPTVPLDFVAGALPGRLPGTAIVAKQQHPLVGFLRCFCLPFGGAEDDRR